MAQVQTRMTRQRAVILEELRKTKSHPTADELYSIVRERLPRISLGTVYRNLDFLAETGEILKLEARFVVWKRLVPPNALTATSPGISMCAACVADVSAT